MTKKGDRRRQREANLRSLKEASNKKFTQMWEHEENPPKDDRRHPSIRAETAGQYVKTVAEPKKEGSLGQKGPSSPPKPKKYATSKTKKIMEVSEGKWHKIKEYSEGRPFGKLMMIWTCGYCLWVLIVETGDLLASIGVWAVVGFGAGVAVMTPIIELIGGEGFKHTPLIWGPVLVYVFLTNITEKIR